MVMFRRLFSHSSIQLPMLMAQAISNLAIPRTEAGISVSAISLHAKKTLNSSSTLTVGMGITFEVTKAAKNWAFLPRNVAVIEIARMDVVKRTMHLLFFSKAPLSAKY